MIILLVLFYLLFPVFIIYLTIKIPLLRKVGAIVIAYAFGLLLGNIGLIPRASDELRALLKHETSLPAATAQQLYEEGRIVVTDLAANQIAGVQDKMIAVVILLAIPLLLFSIDIKKWLKMTKEALFSLLLAMVSLLLAIFGGYYLLGDKIIDSWKVSGLLVGLYTGGTPNLAAIGAALNVDANTFLLTHTYDMAVGAVCLLFLMTTAQQLFNRFLPSFRSKHEISEDEVNEAHHEDIDDFVNLLTRLGVLQLVKAFGFSSLIVAVSGGLSMLVPERAQMVTVILSITTLGLLFSNWRMVNKLKYSFQLGMYFIIVFSLIVSSMGDLWHMFHIEYLHLFVFVAIVVFGSIAIHVFLSFIFRVDTDTTIITITALTYSPPFVPAVAGALKNKQVIVSGLTVGILGYAIGNYLGLFIAYFLQ